MGLANAPAHHVDLSKNITVLWSHATSQLNDFRFEREPAEGASAPTLWLAEF
jgi:hypothetical protein